MDIELLVPRNRYWVPTKSQCIWVSEHSELDTDSNTLQIIRALMLAGF